jgi:hypothetical protein
MVPLLDILQSIPLLSFLPAVTLALVAAFPHSNIGLELASIILIFTSQAKNSLAGCASVLGSHVRWSSNPNCSLWMNHSAPSMCSQRRICARSC